MPFSELIEHPDYTPENMNKVLNAIRTSLDLVREGL